MLLSFSLFGLYKLEGLDLCFSASYLAELDLVSSQADYAAKKAGLTQSKNTLVKLGSELAYDAASSTYYSSHDQLKLSSQPDVSLSGYYDPAQQQYSILAVTADSYQELQLVVTNTRIIKMRTIKEKRKPLKQENDRVILTTYDPDPQVAPAYYHIKKYLRGDPAKAAVKPNYNLRNINKTPMSLFGLPSNRKYVLNSLYTDEYKLRDVLSWAIWSESSAHSNARGIYNSSDLIYVEVFIDDQYEGMYGLQEHINEDKLQLTETKGSIFEIKSNDYPLAALFAANSANWGGIELDYSNYLDGEKWSNLPEILAAFARLPQEQAYLDQQIDLDSFIDYYLFTELVTAEGNTWKNIFLSQSQDTGKLLITPWDLKRTFGASRKDGLIQTSYEEIRQLYRASKQADRFLFQLKNKHSEFTKLAAQRYQELRKTSWTNEKILAHAASYQAFLDETGIYQRDLARWPDSPRIKAGKEDFIQEFIVLKLALMDQLYAD